MKIAIYGYGNLGKGVECAVMQNADMELFGIFTRRPVEDIKPVGEDVKVYPAKDVLLYKKDYTLSPLDKQFITELCNSKRRCV